MAKELFCRDIGPDCDAVVHGESDEEILAQVVEHAKSVHDMTEEQVSGPAFQDHARNQIHEQQQQA